MTDQKTTQVLNERSAIPSMTPGECVWLMVILFLAGGLKLWLIQGQLISFNSDEAVVALMARHILNGARPIFFYGQAYMGSLDAYLIATGFALFGEQVWVIRLVQSLLYLGFLWVTFNIGRDCFRSTRTGLITTGLLAIPTVNISLYTTASLGGYGEAMLIGSLVIWLSISTGRYMQVHHKPGPVWRWLLIGFLAGFGLWAFGLSLVFSLPAGLYLLGLLLQVTNVETGVDSQHAGLQMWLIQAFRSLQQKLRLAWKAILAVMVGLVVGATPLLTYASQNGWGLLARELGGSALAGVEKVPWIIQVGQHLLSLIVFGGSVIIGARPPWDMKWLGVPLLPFVLFFWLLVLIYSFRQIRIPGPAHSAQRLVFGVGVTLSAGFLFTAFGADPSGRYFLPFALPMAIFAGGLIVHAQEKMGKWVPAIVIMVLGYNLWGTLQCAYQSPLGITTQFYAPAQVDQRYMPQLVDFLRQEGETRGFTNYWVSYPLAFLSGEEIIYLPRLPYHLDFRYSERDDRYAAYDLQVAEADQVAYITSRHARLDEYLRTQFATLGVTWKEAQIGDFRVFYALSRLVRPQEMGLGETNP